VDSLLKSASGHILYNLPGIIRNPFRSNPAIQSISHLLYLFSKLKQRIIGKLTSPVRDIRQLQFLAWREVLYVVLKGNRRKEIEAVT